MYFTWLEHCSDDISKVVSSNYPLLIAHIIRLPCINCDGINGSHTSSVVIKVGGREFTMLSIRINTFSSCSYDNFDVK